MGYDDKHIMDMKSTRTCTCVDRRAFKRTMSSPMLHLPAVGNTASSSDPKLVPPFDTEELHIELGSPTIRTAKPSMSSFDPASTHRSRVAQIVHDARQPLSLVEQLGECLMNGRLRAQLVNKRLRKRRKVGDNIGPQALQLHPLQCKFAVGKV